MKQVSLGQPNGTSQDAINQWVKASLAQIEQASNDFRATNSPAEFNTPLRTAAPTNPTDGMLAFADGSLWNPGSGKGLYVYETGVWQILTVGTAGYAVFASQALAAAADLSAETYVSTLDYGYGFGGGALYKKVAGPVTAGGFQSADGTYWENMSEVLYITMFGAKPDNSTNTTPAINDGMALCALRVIAGEQRAPLWFPPGQYNITTLPNAMPSGVALKSMGYRTALLNCNFNPGTDNAVFRNDVNALDNEITDFVIQAGDANHVGLVTSGRCIQISAYSTGGGGFTRLNGLYISGYGSWQKGIYVDGTAKINGAIGQREMFVLDCMVFQCTESCFDFRSVQAMRAYGCMGIPTAPPSFTGDLTNGTNTILNASPTSVALVGYPVVGPGIPLSGATITGVSGSTVTISANATATTVGATVVRGLRDACLYWIGTPNVDFTGTTTTGGTVITSVSSVAGLLVGGRLSGTTIAAGALITAIGVNTVTMSVGAKSGSVGVGVTMLGVPNQTSTLHFANLSSVFINNTTNCAIDVACLAPSGSDTGIVSIASTVSGGHGHFSGCVYMYNFGTMHVDSNLGWNNPFAKIYDAGTQGTLLWQSYANDGNLMQSWSNLNFGSAPMAAMYAGNGGFVATPNVGNAVLKLCSTNNGVSLRSGGTNNASGTDYAEYEIKRDDCGTIKKGDVCGVDADGYLTDRFDLAINFRLKSTAPSMVGGDTWDSHLGQRPEKPRPPALDHLPHHEHHEHKRAHEAQLAQWEDDCEEFEARYEEARERVDRMAYAGKVPCNITGPWKPGFVVIAKRGDDGAILAVAIDDDEVTTPLRLKVGRIAGKAEDGRPIVAVSIN